MISMRVEFVAKEKARNKRMNPDSITHLMKRKENVSVHQFSLYNTVTFLRFSSVHKVFFWILLGFLTDMLTSSAEHLRAQQDVRPRNTVIISRKSLSSFQPCVCVHEPDTNTYPVLHFHTVILRTIAEYICNEKVKIMNTVMCTSFNFFSAFYN